MANNMARNTIRLSMGSIPHKVVHTKRLSVKRSLRPYANFIKKNLMHPIYAPPLLAPLPLKCRNRYSSRRRKQNSVLKTSDRTVQPYVRSSTISYRRRWMISCVKMRVRQSRGENVFSNRSGSEKILLALRSWLMSVLKKLLYIIENSGTARFTLMIKMNATKKQPCLLPREILRVAPLQNHGMYRPRRCSV